MGGAVAAAAAASGRPARADGRAVEGPPGVAAGRNRPLTERGPLWAVGGRRGPCRRPPEADRRSHDERANAHCDQTVTPLVSLSRSVVASGFSDRFPSATLMLNDLYGAPPRRCKRRYCDAGLGQLPHGVRRGAARGGA